MGNLATLGQLVRWVEVGLAMLMVAIAALLVAAAGPILLGYQAYIVLSGSMEPEIQTGSTVVVEKVRPADLRPNDVITFVARGDRIITHRIVEGFQDEGGRGFRTKGDANRVVDSEPARPANVLGRVKYSVPYSGYVISYVNDRGLQPYILALMLAVAVYHFGLRSRLGKRLQAPATGAAGVPATDDGVVAAEQNGAANPTGSEARSANAPISNQPIDLTTGR